MVCLDMLRRAGADTALLDCMHRTWPEINWPRPTQFGCGHYPKTEVPKPHLLRDIPRRFSRYGLPLGTVKQALAQLSPPPDAVLITSIMTYWYPGVKTMVHILREIWPNVPICIGGIYATLCPEHAKKHFPDVDAIFCGCLENSNNWERLWGLLGGSPPAIPTGRGFLPALDMYQRPSFSPILGSRGCPFNCPYCASSLLYSGFEQTNFPAFWEIFYSEYRRGVRDFAFYDDALLICPENFLWPFVDKIHANDLQVRLHTPNALHVRYMDMETCKALKKAGLNTVRLGLESGFRDRNDLKLTREQWQEGVSNLRQAGFCNEDIGAYILFGLPGQDESEIIQAVQIARNSGIRPQLALYTPIPGSEMFATAKKHSFYPLEEPLYQNNSIWPCYPGGFSWSEHSRWKRILQGDKAEKI